MGNQGRSGEGVRLIGSGWTTGHRRRDRGPLLDDRPIWPQGMQRPTDTPPVRTASTGISGSARRPCGRITRHTTRSAARLVGLGAGAWRHGVHVMDASYSMLHLGYPTSVTTYLAYNVVAVPREGGGTRNQRIQYNDSFPPACMVHYTFPARQVGKKKYPP